MTAWPKVRLGEVLHHRKEFITIDDVQTYKRPRVQLHAQGIVLRDEVPGAFIKTKKQQVCRANEFLVAEIDAKVGGFGFVPQKLHDAIVSSHYFLFMPNKNRLDYRFLDWFSKTPAFREQVEAQGSTNYAAIRPADVLGYEIPLPPLGEQRRIVARIEELAAKIAEAKSLRQEIEENEHGMLLSAYSQIVADVAHRQMRDVAPIVRRPIPISIESEYPELGVRSFGRGTFHKPSLAGIEVGSKKLFEIRPGDLLFNNVFAWEGAVAVARPEDAGRYGSHRFIACVPLERISTSTFLCFHFLTRKGLEQLGHASPGGAGRNRTLGLSALEDIEVPVPPYEDQLWFGGLQAKVDALKRVQTETAAEINALLPAILDREFKGEL